MSLILLAPALLSAAVPEFARQMVRLPNLEALFAAGKIGTADDAAEEWLCAQLGCPTPDGAPIAALRLASETAVRVDAEQGYWLCADPIATSIGIDSVRIDRVITDLTQPEATALTQSLNDCFSPDGLRFVAPSASRWYVQCDAPQSIVTTPLWRAIGGSMLIQFPTGNAAPAWRSRLNEAQMLLHSHSVNTARAHHGLLPVGSLWWWGGGSWPALVPAKIDVVVGGPRWIGSACAASRVDFRPLCADASALFQTGTRNTLIVLDDKWEQSALTPDSLVRWEGEWFGALRAALDSGALDQATLVFPWGSGTLRVDLQPPRRSRWQRWFALGGTAAPPPLAETLRAYLQ